MKLNFSLFYQAESGAGGLNPHTRTQSNEINNNLIKTRGLNAFRL